MGEAGGGGRHLLRGAGGDGGERGEIAATIKVGERGQEREFRGLAVEGEEALDFVGIPTALAAAVLEKENAVKAWRDLMGATNPAEAAEGICRFNRRKRGSRFGFGRKRGD